MISVRVKAIGFVQFHPVLPITAEMADARVKTAAGARAVIAIWREWGVGWVTPTSNRVLAPYLAYLPRARSWHVWHVWHVCVEDRGARCATGCTFQLPIESRSRPEPVLLVTLIRSRACLSASRVNWNQQQSQDRILHVVFQVHCQIDRLGRAEMIDQTAYSRTGTR